MSNYHATVIWKRGSQTFTDNKYSRAHQWLFSADTETTENNQINYKTKVDASASTHIVPLPYSVEENVDPEEAFVASISSCHMLFYLAIAAKKKWVIDSYEDKAVGVLEANEAGKMAMTVVTLSPEIKYSDNQPSKDEEEKIHHLAHNECFIANSVLTKIKIEI